MFPDANRLRRLLNYLSIKPLTTLVALEQIQLIDPATSNRLTLDTLKKLERIRRAVYNYKDYNQIGLFEFRVGLILMELGWYSESAECFRKAGSLWSFLPERPNICLANFANGVAHHRNRRFDLAEQTYSDVREQIDRIREEVNVPSSIPQIKKYQDFVKDLTAQLVEAQKTVTRDILYDLSPRIHPSLQADSPVSSSPLALKVDQEILQTNIQHHFNAAELQALCFDLRIDFSALEGQRLAAKVRELVSYCIRNRRMSGFLQELSRRKPDVSWEENILQPVIEEGDREQTAVPEAPQGEVVEGQFETVDSAEPDEEEIVFSRTGRGKIRFHTKEEGARSTSVRMVIVNVELSGNFSQFALEEQEQFVQFLSRVTDIDPDQITLLEVMAGSIRVTLEMPEGSARQLIDMLLEEDPVLRNFRILKVELGESVGQSLVGEPIVNTTPDIMQKVTPQILRQFIALYFNDSELRNLYFDLNVGYDDLPGEGKRDKAREIVTYCNSHHTLQELVELCQEQRPKAFVKAFSDI
ncbi:MAG: hypothetical protein WAM60_01780 [Candidatus Promineifilaceae bacterium]